MMFLQFFIWGAWYATAGNYMNSIGMTDEIYWAYTVSPIGSVISPLFLGMVADRFFAAEKVMGVLHLLSGAFVFSAPFLAEGAVNSTTLFIGMLLLHMLCYMPTIGLATSMAFHNIDDKEKEFPPIRMFGTLGWIIAGFLVSYVLHADETAMPMYIAGVAGILMGLYSFSLPHVAPPEEGEDISVWEAAGFDALNKLWSRSFIVFIVSILLISVPLAAYYSYTPVFLNAANIADPAFKMTFGQMSEILFLLLMPLFLLRFGIKWVLFGGMMAWSVRYGLFAIGAPDSVMWIIMAGILLHGISYDFVYIAGQIYVDEASTKEIRSRAQSFFVLVTYGLGQGVGAVVIGWIFNWLVTSDVESSLVEWQMFWLVPVALALLVSIGFALMFREEVEVEARTVA